MVKSLAKILVCLIFIIPIQTQAQRVGFGGKKNEVGLDVLSTFQRQFYIDYKRSIKKHFSLLVGFNFQTNKPKFERELSPNPINYEILYSGYSVSIGILFNSKKPNMPMPIGFYGGLKLARHQGNMIQATTVLLENETNGYQHQSNLITFVVGRDIALSNNTSIDLVIEPGIRFGKFLAADDSENIEPGRIYPLDFPFRSEETFSIDENNGEPIVRYFRYHFLPRVKIGYLF